MTTPKKPRKSKEEVLAKLSALQRRQLEEIEANAIADFEGVLDELESALGMLHLGHHFGWKVLYLIHSKRTIRKYERILGIKIRDVFDETGPSSHRLPSFNIVEKLSNFWKAIGGEISIKNRREVSR